MRPVLLPLLTAAWLGLTAAGARAEEVAFPDVKDGAGLFTPEAVEQAERAIAKVREMYHLDLMVETVRELPERNNKWLKLWNFWNRRQRNSFLENWARERAKAAGVNGVFILICNDPSTVHVVVWPPEWERKFTAADCERVRRFLVRRLETGSRDEALLATVTEVADELERRATGQDDESLSANVVVVGAVVAGLFGAWGALRLVGRRLRRAAPDGGAREKAERVQERPARFGALFGTPAAFWVYDKLFRAVPPAPDAAPLPLREPVAAADHAAEGASHEATDAPVQQDVPT
jgi:hypothetical protein